MSTIGWQRVSVAWRQTPSRPTKRPAIESPAKRSDLDHQFTCASHIRGIVKNYTRSENGYAHYWWEVINTRTGKVIARSDAFGLTSAIASCSEAVYVARGAMFWSLRAKDLS